MEKLQNIANFKGPKGPVLLVIMDGVGIGKYAEGDYVKCALKPNFDWLQKNAVYTQLKAHGRAVGMPSDEDMGNSEIGHNAIGCGRVFEQGAALVSNAIASGAIFKDTGWRQIADGVLKNQSTLHFIGLFSDGNVHSHIDHLEAMLRQAKAEGIKKARIHLLLDGRDVPPTSALLYVDRFEAFLQTLTADGSVDYRIASGGGRMGVTMDRYEADWRIVERGWKTHVRGDARLFASAREAIETYRKEIPGILDQDLPAFVIAEHGQPIGKIVDGDGVIFFNFRGDRAIEITRAFEEEHFDKFARGPRPNVLFAGMMQYDGDLKLPKRYLVAPPGIERTMSEYLVHSGVHQMAISETQKFGHVTYFFNGNRSGKFSEALEDYFEVPSDRLPFEQRPWMKAAEVTDAILEAITGGKYRFIRVNYPNGDMVGHTGVYPAVKIAVETVDLCLGRLMKAVAAAGGIMVVTADHGNADDMYEHAKKTGATVNDEVTGQPKPKTSHSLNPVPCFVWDPAGTAKLRLAAGAAPTEKGPSLGISSLAATCMKLLGFVPPADYDAAVVDVG
jgi:2,3-bisphosphoglycerate-independent phosphoglycerate mutase